MTVHSDQLYGREPVIQLVRGLMAREKVGGSLRNQHSPILVAEGFRGTGKTALLHRLDTMLDQQVPHALLDFEDNRNASIPEVLSALAFELSRECPRYGALDFRRFVIGQYATTLDLDLTSRAKAKEQLKEALKSLRGFCALKKVLVETAGKVLDTTAGSTGSAVKAIVEYLVSRILDWLPERFILGPPYQWYGHRDLSLTNDPSDVLVDLNCWARNYKDEAKDEDDRRRVDDLLWAAFLADLRTDFDHGWHADKRSLNCVVLLDNADTIVGRCFLEELARIRRQRVAGGHGDGDPLTVVVTSRGALLEGVADADWASVPPAGADAGQLHRTSNGYLPWWLRYRLPDLNEDGVGAAVDALGLSRGNDQRLTRVVFQLTGGHPASTSAVLDAIARCPPGSRIQPEAILGRPTALGSARAQEVEDQVLSGLLAGVSKDAIPDLETCATARERRHALLLASDGVLMVGQTYYLEVLDTILWPPDGAAGAALLRRLLLRRRARRAPTAALSWVKVHSWLRDACSAEQHEVGELYYALAMGELAVVVRRLHQRRGELADAPWLALVESVAAAPHQHCRQESPIDGMWTLVRGADLEEPLLCLARLVAGLWIVNDPFCDSDRGHLYRQLAAACSEVARLWPGGPSAVLLQAARRYQLLAEWWG